MKRFTLFFLATLLSVVSFAQKPALKAPLMPFAPAKEQVKMRPQGSATALSKAPRRAASLVTLPEDANVETWTVDQSNSMFYMYTETGFVDYTSLVKSVNVAVVGNEVFVQGLAYWFKDAWIQGTLAEGKVTFPAMTFVGADDYGSEYLAGSVDSENPSAFTMTYDAAAQTLTLDEGFSLFECDEDVSAGILAYAYWSAISLTGGYEAPQAVVLPEGVELVEYALNYQDRDDKACSAAAAVAVDGNDVYFKGFSAYIPDALIRGTKEGNTVTFPVQYMGTYSGYDGYLYEEAVFTYNPDDESYAAEGQVYSVLGDKYYDLNTFNPVLTKVTEKAAMPAAPSITALSNTQYGYVIAFDVPNVDVNGESIASSKLFYQLFTDTEQEVAPLVFTPETHVKLTEELTVIPFGFTDGYDFFSNKIYFNDLFSNDWNKIGIKSIYTGGGETNETEIQWFDIKPYSVLGATFDFNALPEDTPVSNDGHDGDITESTDLVEGDVTLTISPSTTSTANRYWKTTGGIQLRVYGGTLTFAVPEGLAMTSITFNNGKWDSKNSADSGEFDSNVWTGNAQQVVVTIGGNTQLNSIVVAYSEVKPELVTLPEGVEPQTWTLEGVYYTNQGGTEEEIETEVAFDGTDIYVKGLAYYFPEAWIQGSIENGIATFPTGQFVGEDEYGNEFLLGSDDFETICDIVFAYDAEAQTLTQQTACIIENAEKNEISAYGYWDGVLLHAGKPEVLEPVVAPEDLITETYQFKGQALENSDDNSSEFVDYGTQVQVGFDGDDLYIQGIATDCPELWVKATKNAEGQYVIPANQYMGQLSIWDGIFVFDYFFTAVNPETAEMEDVVLNYNAETNTLSTDQILALNGAKRSLEYYMLYKDVTIMKLNEFAATPADPVITAFNISNSYSNIRYDIPLLDIEGNDLLADKLSYLFYIIDADNEQKELTLTTDLYKNLTEDMTEIPYTFSDDWDIYNTILYLKQDVEVIKSWKKIGLQSIYRGLGEEHRSNIEWFDIENYLISTGINNATADAKKSVIYNLQGQRVEKAGKGLHIINGKKVMIK